VAEIVLDASGKTAVGVRMKRDDRVIKAPVVVSAAGICNTVSLYCCCQVHVNCTVQFHGACLFLLTFSRFARLSWSVLWYSDIWLCFPF
jgi:hypothetical protein